MEGKKNTYYLNLESGEVLEEPVEPEGHFTLHATNEEILRLREYLDENHNDDWQAFGKAHLLLDDAEMENRKYDHAMKEVYKMIYQLGDQEARNHVQNMGILDESRLDR